MEVQAIIGEVAKRHGILCGSNDPVFALVTMNELLLREYVDHCKQAMEQAQDEVCATAAEQVEAAKDLATRLVRGAGALASEQLKKAGETMRLELTRAVQEEIAAARDAVLLAQTAARSAWWAVGATLLGVLGAIAWRVLPVLKV